MGICRGTSTRFQFCGKQIPAFGSYPNVCGASPANFNPNVPRDSGVAIARAKTRRVTGRSAAKYSRSVDPNQVVTAVQIRLNQQPYNGKRGERSLCAASRSGGIGKMFGHGRAKRCFNAGCVCGSSVTDTPGNFSGTTPDSSERIEALTSLSHDLNYAREAVVESDGSIVGLQTYAVINDEPTGVCVNVMSDGATIQNMKGPRCGRKVTGAPARAQQLCNQAFTYSNIPDACPASLQAGDTAACGTEIWIDDTAGTPGTGDVQLLVSEPPVGADEEPDNTGWNVGDLFTIFGAGDTAGDITATMRVTQVGAGGKLHAACYTGTVTVSVAPPPTETGFAAGITGVVVTAVTGAGTLTPAAASPGSSLKIQAGDQCNALNASITFPS